MLKISATPAHQETTSAPTNKETPTAVLRGLTSKYLTTSRFAWTLLTSLLVVFFGTWETECLNAILVIPINTNQDQCVVVPKNPLIRIVVPAILFLIRIVKNCLMMVNAYLALMMGYTT